MNPNGAAAVHIERQDDLTRIANQVSSLVVHVEDLNRHVSNTLERRYGAGPEAPSDAADYPKAVGTLSEVDWQLNLLRDRIQVLEGRIRVACEL